MFDKRISAEISGGLPDESIKKVCSICEECRPKEMILEKMGIITVEDLLYLFQGNMKIAEGFKIFLK